MSRRSPAPGSARAARSIAGVVALCLGLALPIVDAPAPAGAAAPSGCGPFTAVVADHTGDAVSTVEVPLRAPVAVGPIPLGVAVTPDGTRVLVVSEVGDGMTVVAADSGAVVAKVDFIGSPGAVAITPDGSKALVTDAFLPTVRVLNLTVSPPTVSATVGIGSGNSLTGIAITPDGTRALVTANDGGGRMHVLDLTASPPVVAATVTTGDQASGVAIVPDGSAAFVTDPSLSRVYRMDLTVSPPVLSAAVSLPGGSQPTAVAVTPDGETVFVANHNGTVSTIAMAGLVVGGPIAVGTQLGGIASTTRTVVVTDTAGDSVVGIDIASLTVSPAWKAVGAAPGAVAVTPDGSTAFVANRQGASVSTVVVANLDPIAAGPSTAPRGVAVTPDGSRALVTNEADDSVSVVDLATRAVVGGPIAVGDAPFGIAVAPDGSTALVTNRGAATVSVIDLTGAPPVVVSTVAVGSAPKGVAVTPDGTRAVVADSGDQAVSVLDLTVSPPAPVGGAPVALAGTPYGVAVAPTGAQAYVSVAEPSSFDNVSVIDLTVSPPALSREIPLSPVGGEQAAGIAVAPDGTVYVAETARRAVGQIDVGSGTVVPLLLPVGSEPVDVAVAPDGRSLLVSDAANAAVRLVPDVELPATPSVLLSVGGGPAGIAFVPTECPVPTTTSITADSPDPSVAGTPYTVSGTVTVDWVAPVSSLPGSVTVTGEGSGCVDPSLTPTGTPNEFAFSCTVTAGADGGSATVTATHVDAGTDYATSYDTEDHGVIAAPAFTG